MGFWDKLKAALGREAAEAKDVYADATRRAEADLARRERELQETPQEKLERMARELEDGPDPFDEVKARLERMRAPLDPPLDPGGPPAPGPTG